MAIYFSSSPVGFHSQDFKPAGAVLISAETYNELLSGQANGLLIAADSAGQPVLIERPAPTEAEQIAGFVLAVQKHMDQAAKAAGYDNISTAVTYAEEPAVPRFQAEGQAFRAWRSHCWAYCYDLLAAVKAGQRGSPSTADLLAGLPALEMPA